MIPDRRLKYALCIWIALVVLWPANLQDHSPVNPDENSHKSGEGLYKASLTNANFGLLGVRFYESAEGRRHWDIRSRFAELHRKENYAFLREVEAQFFAERTGNTVLVQSNYGRSWTDKNLIELEGNVSIESRRGYKFEMDKVVYHSEGHEFRTDEPVRMSGPDPKRPTMFLNGVGMLAKIDEERFLVRKNVTAQRKLKGQGWLKIQGREGQFFTDESRALFSRSVRAVLPSLALESDILELTLEDESETIYAQGKVVLRSKDRVGYADTALIKAGSDQILLEGRARVESSDNRLEGRRIMLYTEDDRIEVEEAAGKLQK